MAGLGEAVAADAAVHSTSFNAVGTLFAQYVAGYVGSSVERRGKKAEQDAVWSIVELRAVLDEWVVTTWQNRPHSGLRHPIAPDKALTPNEQNAALVEIAGYVPVPLGAGDYVELLPVTWDAINKYGIKLNKRTYHGKALNPYRRQHSGVERKKGLWEVHYDPYDVTRIWVRNHHDDGWITVPWKHLRSAPAPFGELAWRLAQANHLSMLDLGPTWTAPRKAPRDPTGWPPQADSRYQSWPGEFAGW